MGRLKASGANGGNNYHKKVRIVLAPLECLLLIFLDFDASLNFV